MRLVQWELRTSRQFQPTAVLSALLASAAAGYRYLGITPSTKPIADAQMTVLAGPRPAHRWRRDPRAARGAVASRQSMTQRVSPRRAVHAHQMKSCLPEMVILSIQRETKRTR